MTENYLLLLLATAVAGGGFAAIYGIGTTILADTSNPARWYGVKIAAVAFPGAVRLFVLPLTLIPSQGFPGTAYGLIIAALLLSPLLLLLPARGSKDRETGTESQLRADFSTLDRRPIWSALIATFVFFCAASGMWAFIERLGSKLGFEADAIGTLLSITLLFATCGSLLTAWLGERFGNVRPFYASCLAMLTSLTLLALFTGFGAYASSTCLLTFAIGMGLPFAVAEVAELDVDGRFIILSVPAIGLGAMIGPGVAGALADAGSFTPVLIAAGVAIVVAMLLLRYSKHVRR
jgi:predicted MFS family arabinose efflux permease